MKTENRRQRKVVRDTDTETEIDRQTDRHQDRHTESTMGVARLFQEEGGRGSTWMEIKILLC